MKSKLAIIGLILAALGFAVAVAGAGCSRQNPGLVGDGNGGNGGSGGSGGGVGGVGVGSDGGSLGGGGGSGGGGLGGGGGSGGGGSGGSDGGAPITPSSCSGKAAQPSDGTWMLTVGSTMRTAEFHVPKSYDPTKPTPLIISFHGYTSNGAEQAFITGLTTKSDAVGFVVVYPEGTGTPSGFNAGACCGTAATSMVDDIGFTKALIAMAADKLCLDAKRVFVNGFSNGGFMSHRIACELADRVAAVGPVSGVLGIPAADCTPARAISVIDFHGMSDTTVPYAGSAADGWPSATDTFAGWAARDKCTDGTPANTYTNGDVSCATYSKCDGGAAVTLCTISDGGHAWPGSTFPLPGTTQNINATDAMWTFFQAHPMP